MSAEVLRRAASLMRERAEAASGHTWRASGGIVLASTTTPFNEKYIADCFDEPGGSDADAEHIASWHPAVALAVADWLDACAQFMEEEPDYTHDGEDFALTVARAYLGESAGAR